MTVHKRQLTYNDLHTIATYMDDEIREQVHLELAPCSPTEFISRYLELDPGFETLLESEFNFAR